MHIHQAVHVCQGDWIFIKVHKNAKKKANIHDLFYISTKMFLKKCK